MGQGNAFFPGLLARAEIALEHESHNRVAAVAELPKHVSGNEALSGVILTGVVVRTIDHDGAGDAFTCDSRFGFGDLLFFVVRFSTSAAEHDVPVRVSQGSD